MKPLTTLPAFLPATQSVAEFLPSVTLSHYHFLGIGGIGMSALAFVLHEKGYSVSGMDKVASPITAALQQQGIPVQIETCPDMPNMPHTVVYSSAIGSNHPIWKKIPADTACISRAQLLAHLLSQHNTLAVAGTHGKTSCSAILGTVLLAAGWDPTIFVGGQAAALDGRNYRQGQGKWAVCEADESDGGLLSLSPHGILLTNVEDDHLDFHQSFQKLEECFLDFVRKLPDNGVFVYCHDHPGARHIAKCYLTEGGKAKTIGYGMDKATDVRIQILTKSQEGMTLQITHAEHTVEIATPLIGQHNALNVGGVSILAAMAGVPWNLITAGLKGACSVARRRQYLGKTGNLYVYDDYAHHPTEISATLESLRAVHNEPLIALFQPHLYSRTTAFAKAFAQALHAADQVIVTDVYAARESTENAVSGEIIVDALHELPAMPYPPRFVKDWRTLVSIPPAQNMAGNAVLALLGAGDITEIGPLLFKPSIY